MKDWLNYDNDEVAGLRAIDIAFGRFLASHCPHASERALGLAVRCSVNIGHGNPVLAVSDDDLDCLLQSGFVGSGVDNQPLVLSGKRLYMARYWRAAERIKHSLAVRLEQKVQLDDFALARKWLDLAFADAQEMLPDWQKIACANALLNNFSIITGGPGTGKTTTVLALLSTLQALALADGAPTGLRIRLVAPTGKAAARLSESIGNTLQRLGWHKNPQFKAVIDTLAVATGTLHALLGIRPDTVRVLYNADKQLDLDVLVVDEASMLDIELMDSLLAALPINARLVLLGDKNQLASVEAGAIFGELCQSNTDNKYSIEHSQKLFALTGQELAASDKPITNALAQAVVTLKHSYRFDAGSGIGRLAAAVNSGDLPAIEALRQNPMRDLSFVSVEKNAPEQWLYATGLLASDAYPALFKLVHQTPGLQSGPAEIDAWALAVLQQQARLQVLCALRKGRWGVQGLNSLIHKKLSQAGFIEAQEDSWYPGRPIIVLRNMPGLGLSNGDIGIALNIPDSGQAAGKRVMIAFYGAAGGSVHWVAPARLPEVETVFALTVHKSQGSEFERVVLVLPEFATPLLTRELLYTGVTRARAKISLVMPGSTATLAYATEHKTNRLGVLAYEF